MVNSAEFIIWVKFSVLDFSSGSAVGCSLQGVAHSTLVTRYLQDLWGSPYQSEASLASWYLVLNSLLSIHS